MAKLDALDVAKYFLCQTDVDDAGDLISNLKLQKLLYYAQGYHLAIFDEPLFDDEIEAWNHGPVVRSVYDEFKRHGSNAIPTPEGIDLSIFSDEQRDFLNEVYRVFGQYSAWKLRNMTHEEPPWKDAHTPSGQSVITHDSLRAFFKQQVQSE